MSDARDRLAAEVVDLLGEWRRTCKTMGLRWTDIDAGSFVADALVHRLATGDAAVAEVARLDTLRRTYWEDARLWQGRAQRAEAEVERLKAQVARVEALLPAQARYDMSRGQPVKITARSVRRALDGTQPKEEK